MIGPTHNTHDERGFLLRENRGPSSPSFRYTALLFTKLFITPFKQCASHLIPFSRASRCHHSVDMSWQLGMAKPWIFASPPVSGSYTVVEGTNVRGRRRGNRRGGCIALTPARLRRDSCPPLARLLVFVLSLPQSPATPRNVLFTGCPNWAAREPAELAVTRDSLSRPVSGGGLAGCKQPTEGRTTTRNTVRSHEC